MINIQKLLETLPCFNKYCSVNKINSLVDELRGDSRFRIKVAGNGNSGIPIHHVRFNTGSIKVLVVAGPHADEPIGSATVYSLLKLLNSNFHDLVSQDIEWNIVPCIDPDGAILNEGWSQKPFSFENFVRHSFKQNPADQAEFSFPLNYKKLAFNKQTPESKTLKNIIEETQPDYYFSLHNSIAGGAYFLINKDVDSKYYPEIHKLAETYKIPLKKKVIQDQYGKGINTSINSYPKVKDIYDHLSKSLDDPSKHLNWGNSSKDYLESIKKDAITFVAELSHVRHPSMSSDKITDINLREMKLRVDAQNKYLFTVLIEEWDRVSEYLNVDSPFYRKMAPQINYAKDYLHECFPEMQWLAARDLLFSPLYSGYALEEDVFNTYMTDRYYAIAYSYSFVRLLKDSGHTAAVMDSIERLEALFDSALTEIKNHIDFSSFELIDINDLVKMQLGSGMIILNAILEKKKPLIQWLCRNFDEYLFGIEANHMSFK